MSKKATKVSKSVSKKASKSAAQVAVQAIAAEPVVTPPPTAETTAAAVTVPAAAAKASKASERKAPVAPREGRNGVKRPKAGGACARVWDHLDATGDMSVADVRGWAEREGLNPGNAAIEIYLWRKFTGIAKRVKTPMEKEVKQAA